MSPSPSHLAAPLGLPSIRSPSPPVTHLRNLTRLWTLEGVSVAIRSQLSPHFGRQCVWLRVYSCAQLALENLHLHGRMLQTCLLLLRRICGHRRRRRRCFGLVQAPGIAGLRGTAEHGRRQNLPDKIQSRQQLQRPCSFQNRVQDNSISQRSVRNQQRAPWQQSSLVWPVLRQAAEPRERVGQWIIVNHSG